MNSAQHKYVQPKSPLEILGVYITLVRERFSLEGGDFPWKWTSDNATTAIFIEAGNSSDNNQTDGRPAIYVNRDSIVAPRLVIGDRVDEVLKTGEKTYYTVATGRMAIDCVSANSGESSIIAELVHSHLLMTGDVLLEYFRFRDFTPLTLGPTQAWEQDDRLFHTRVTSEFSYDIRWKSMPITSRIQSLALTINSSQPKNLQDNPPEAVDLGNGEESSPFPPFHKIALESINRD